MSGTVAMIEHTVLAARVTGREATDSPGKWCFFFLCLFTVAIYARPEDIFPIVGHFHLTLVLGLCASAAYAGAWFCGSIPLLNSRELRLMLWLTAWFVAGVPFAYWRGGSLQVLSQEWFKTLLVFFLLTQTLVSLRRIRAVLWAIVLSELAITVYSVLNPSRSMWVGGRFSGVSEGILGWNFLGIAIALTLPFIAALFIARVSLVKLLLLSAAVGAMLWMLVLTASRSGMLTVAFSILLTYLLILRRSSLGNIVALGLVVAMALAVCAAPGVFWQRIQTIWSDSAPANAVSASADASGEERRNVLVTSLRYTLEHPLFGLGLGNFSVARGTETGVPSGWLGTHNTFTELSSEAGIPGLLIFVFLIGTSIRNMWRIARSESVAKSTPEVDQMARGALASLVAFVFGALFAHIAYEYFLYYPVAIAVGVQYLASTKETLSIKNHAGARARLHPANI